MKKLFARSWIVDTGGDFGVAVDERSHALNAGYPYLLVVHYNYCPPREVREFACSDFNHAWSMAERLIEHYSGVDWVHVNKMHGTHNPMHGTYPQIFTPELRYDYLTFCGYISKERGVVYKADE